MEDQPLVSIIVPVYGAEHSIERCARSIFEQTYSNLEIIYINDCTPDRSIDKLESVLLHYPSRISQTRIINFEKNRGVASGRKLGLSLSMGKYTIQFDSDDYVEIDMLERMVQIAEMENAEVTICDYWLEYNHTRKQVHVNPSLIPHVCLSKILSGEMHSSLCNKLIRKSLYTNNSIDFIEGLNMREDLSVVYRLLYFAKGIAYISEPFYHYVQNNPKSYTAKKMSVAHQNNAIFLIKEMNNFFSVHSVSPLLHRAYFQFLSGIISTIALYGNIPLYKENIGLFSTVTQNDISTSPAISKLLKLCGILLIKKKFFLLYCIRFVQRTKKKYLSVI